ncbi:MAG: class I SAM-dependent methyltransferase [Actinobacteria bacterium]|nr:class I SAM-dependent methyltransferase [Actinomycetota bacterium]
MDHRAARAKRLFDLVYGALCGVHPNLRPWHFQWLATKDLYRELGALAPQLEGRILDVGCGGKPYWRWLTSAQECVGLDVTADSEPDIVVVPGERWPVDDASFDAVLATQVLEHVRDFDNVRSEIDRVLKPRGRAVISVPFIYNEHGAPDDLRRFSAYGVAQIFPPDWEVLEVRRLGSLGSSIGILFLNWADISLSKTWPTKVLKVALLPAWIAVSAIVNGIGAVLDSIGDRSVAYVNVLAVFLKPGADG